MTRTRSQDERVDHLLDDTRTVEHVTGTDIRWMVLLMRKELASELAFVKAAVGRMEANGATVKNQVADHTKAIQHIEHVEADCPLSTREKQTVFVKEIMESYAAEIAVSAAAKAVETVPAAKAVVGNLTRPELINVLVGAVVVLATVIAWIVTNGRVPLPGQ